MKYLFVLFSIFTILVAGNALAQKEAAVWMLGKHSKSLDFNSGQPVPIADGKSNIIYGSASICDTSGKLLFYTDGQTVWNANYQKMINGDLKGNSWSNQPAVVVPVYKSIYYIFHTQGEGRFPIQNPQPTQYDTTLRYSIVDIKKSNGLGEVISKDIPLLLPASNCVAAIKHANGIDTWVVTLTNRRKQGVEYDSFYAFLITSCGISDTVISKQDLYGSGFANIRVKFSPNGNKIFVTAGDDLNNFVDYLLEFDNSSGVVSNLQELCNPVSSQQSSFSPDSKFLYCFLYNQSLGPTRYDLSQTNICTNKYEVNYPTATLTIQCGINGQLYGVAGSGIDDAQLIVVNNSDFSEADSIKPHTLYLGNYYSYTFPNFIESYFDPNYHTPVAPTFSTTRICNGDQAKFALNTNRFSMALKNVQWNFGDGTSSSLLNPLTSKDTVAHIYTKAGKYNVKFYLHYDCMLDSIEREIIVDSIPSIELGTDQKICNGTNITLAVSEGYTNYLWNTGDRDNSLLINTEGAYSITVSNTCGIASDTVRFIKQDIWLSNLITSNGDDKNETLVVTGLDDKHGHLSVYDRWGAKVYENNNYHNEWDAGSQEGVYYYNFKTETCPVVNGWVQVIK